MPRHRKRIDYAPMSKTPGEIINEVKEAFVALPPKAGATDAETEKAIQRAVHQIVVGLSRATAHPPAWFRLAGRPIESKKGRPRAIEGRFIAGECAWHYTAITGRRAVVGTDSETHEATGDYFALAKAVFSALSMPDSAEKCARAAVRSQGTSAH